LDAAALPAQAAVQRLADVVKREGGSVESALQDARAAVVLTVADANRFTARQLLFVDIAILFSTFD
jgi:hypothetical protein